MGKNDVVTDDTEIQNDDGVGDTLVDESTEVEYHCPVCSKVFDKVRSIWFYQHLGLYFFKSMNIF